MSEYQYYEFRAIDRPLTKTEMSELRSISTRAMITSTSFTNHYEWGDLKADPFKLLEKYFDVFVYITNWGTRILCFRLPQDWVGYKQLKSMLSGECVQVHKSGNFVIVTFECEVEDSEWDDGTRWMGSLMQLRHDVLRGDLRSLYLRATACAACHQVLEPALLKAGHPDLFFELDSQSVAEPKHWKDNADSWNGLREWLTGQAVALREMSWALASDPQNDQWSIARWNGLAWLCATATNAAAISSPIIPPPDSPGPSDFTNMHTQADSLARRAAVSNWSEGSARDLLTALASSENHFSTKAAAIPILGQRAKRLVLALDRLANALNQNRGFRLKVDTELNQLFEDVRTLDSFDASAFAAHLQAFRAALDKVG